MNLDTYSQIGDPEIISYDVFKEIRIGRVNTQKSVKLGFMYELNGNWSSLSNSLGINSVACDTQESGAWCKFQDNGLSIVYSDYSGEDTFASLEIFNNNFFYEISGVKIKVGDNISKVSNIHNKTYNNRHKVPFANPDEYQALL